MNGSENSIEIVKVDEAKSIKTLLDESIVHIADSWIEQLNILRDNTNMLEQQILAYVGKTKADISALHELGAKVTEEAQRGREICEELRKGLEKIA